MPSFLYTIVPFVLGRGSEPLGKISSCYTWGLYLYGLGVTQNGTGLQPRSCYLREWLSSWSQLMTIAKNWRWNKPIWTPSLSRKVVISTDIYLHLLTWSIMLTKKFSITEKREWWRCERREYQRLQLWTAWGCQGYSLYSPSARIPWVREKLLSMAARQHLLGMFFKGLAGINTWKKNSRFSVA